MPLLPSEPPPLSLVWTEELRQPESTSLAAPSTTELAVPCCPLPPKMPQRAPKQPKEPTKGQRPKISLPPLSPTGPNCRLTFDPNRSEIHYANSTATRKSSCVSAWPHPPTSYHPASPLAVKLAERSPPPAPPNSSATVQRRPPRYPAFARQSCYPCLIVGSEAFFFLLPTLLPPFNFSPEPSSPACLLVFSPPQGRLGKSSTAYSSFSRTSYSSYIF